MHFTTRLGMWAAVLVITACSPDPAEIQRRPNLPVVAPGGGFQAMLNDERARRGRPALRQSARLATIARGHAQDMSANGFFSHTGADGRQLGDRARANGYRFCWIAENIAQGQKSEAAVMQSWMNSAGHRRNNLAREAQEFGLARATGDYWVLVLAKPGC